MKKIAKLIVAVLVISSLLSIATFAATIVLEDSYAPEGSATFVAFNGVKPFVADSANVEALEDANYWIGKNAEKFNFKYVGFVGDMSSGANYLYADIVQSQGKPLQDLYTLTENDKEWMNDFTAIKDASIYFTEFGVPYGISIGLNDYCSNGLDRRNHVQTAFEIDDFIGSSGYKYEYYDNNNFAVIIPSGNTTYIVYVLEAFPRLKTIDWFRSIQANNLDKRAIIYTTSFIDKSGAMFTQHDWTESGGKLPSNYREFTSKCKTNLLTQDQPHDGTQLWEKVLALYDNILCIISANDTVGTEIVTNVFNNNNGYPVLSVLANLNGGYGNSGKPYPILINVSEDCKTIDLRYAVPDYNKVGGYIKESHKEIVLSKVAELPKPDPYLSLPRVKTQPNGNNVAFINGYENNLFKPNNNMTKAEACIIFARLLTQTQNIPDGYTTRFTDVKEGDWYYNAIAYLDEVGYFYTNTDEKYHPNDKITRAEFVELAYFASSVITDEKLEFADVDKNSKYYKAISTAAAIGLVNGYGDGSFKPNATITRAEVVTIINRLISVVANKDTVSLSRLDKKFSDISGHWAEYQILMASNNNVHGDYYYNADLSSLKENASEIFFETDYVRITITKKGGTVKEILNKATGQNALGNSATPWFTYLISDKGANIQPKTLEIDNGRLKVTFRDDTVAYYIVEAKKDYFSVTLDTDLPNYLSGAVICQLTTNAPWELDNKNAFGLSGVAMTTLVDNTYFPGGSSKAVKGSVFTVLPVPTLGAKIGVSFSDMSIHRETLKSIAKDIDKTKGLTSTKGGPYALETKDAFVDYIIMTDYLTPENAVETAELAYKYSVEQIDIHQGSGGFVQADFNFVSARTEEEKEKQTFIPASVFKERIADKITNIGVQLSLHTYSSLVPTTATNILSNPKWQKDLAKGDTTWTLRGNHSKGRTSLKTLEDASNFKTGDRDIPYKDINTRYILIDEEIIRVQQGTTSGFINVKRGQCGTAAASHKDGAIIYQLNGWFSMFQPEPLSDLFYYVAEETARTYNEGGFEMIYLDGLESFHSMYCDKTIAYYIYAEFVRAVVSNCNTDPMIEYSSFFPCLWSARARGGAVDYARRGYKKFKDAHIQNQAKFPTYFYTATVGWFDYAPDRDEQYKDTTYKTMYRDDLDHMGSLALAYDFSTVCAHFSVQSLNEKTRLADNFMYYGLYTRLREGGYFSPEVKKEIINGEYEYKLIRQADGSWAFKEMKYAKHKVYDMNEPNFAAASLFNPFEAQTPFIRIEHKYSTKGDDGVLLYDFDETKPVKSLVGKYSFSEINATNKYALKLRVCGNGSINDAVLISLSSLTGTGASGRYDYFIPVNFKGWKELIIPDISNDDYEGYTFSTVTTGGARGEVYRTNVEFNRINSVQVSVQGNCEGVFIDQLVACTPYDAPAKNPSITVGGTSITFNAELHSSDFIEYYPEENKAYLNYYTQIYDEEGKWVDDEAHVKEISFNGSLTVPKGNFSFSYKAEAMSSLPTRAQVVFGFGGRIIANPSTWVAPNVELPKDIEKVSLY